MVAGGELCACASGVVVRATRPSLILEHMFDVGGYAELHARSAYTFGEGVDEPATLVKTAADLGLSALALTDRDGLFGVIQARRAATQSGIPVIIGAELSLDTGERLPILTRSPAAYAALSRAISVHNLRADHQVPPAHRLDDLLAIDADWLILTGDATGPLHRLVASGDRSGAQAWLDRVIAARGRDHVAVESCLQGFPGEDALADAFAELARTRKIPLVATTGARCAHRDSQRLADVLEARRLGLTLDEAWGHLPATHPTLRSVDQMRRLHRRHPHAVDQTLQVAAACVAGGDPEVPKLPHPPVPPGHTPHTWLRELTRRGARTRWGDQAESKQVRSQLDHELSLIEQLDFSGYFLIVTDIVDFCRSRNILTQGRGSAANSAVCYALGVTAVDAVRYQMHFERFLTPGRVSPPDIDLDIEAGRREEVIAYVYERYGRERAAQVGTVISYRPRSALRDVARTLGFGEGTSAGWVRHSAGGARRDLLDASVVPPPVGDLARRLQRLPRHMGIHSGGMILCDRPVIDVCPIAWGKTPGRTVLQWDKEDCADAGLVKFDLLGLGMLTALRLAFTSLTRRGVTPPAGDVWDMAALDPDNPRVFDLLQRADTVGVFQVESRAQMAVLPRLRPETFYDIVIEVALVRPGPIQGQAVNPYLRRRRGREPVTYPHPVTRRALEKTLGVALFQEQLMQLAEDAAGFTPAQADQLRKAIGAKHADERLAELRPALFAGMAERGITGEAADAIWGQLQGFADFGFPESHAFSFAGIVYASAWLKVHYPEDFYAAILAAQPMGFYSPLTLIEDARRHGVRVLAADVTFSDVDARVEAAPDAPSGLAVRLGLAPLSGIGKRRAAHIVTTRTEGGPFTSLDDFVRRTRLPAATVDTLALAGAFASLTPNRRAGMWAAGGLAVPATGEGSWYQDVLPGTGAGTTAPDLPAMSPADRMVTDLRLTGTTHAGFPTAFVRDDLHAAGVLPLADLGSTHRGHRVCAAGLITHRQRPHTAAGTTFLSLQDETGLLNVICSPGLWERFRPILAQESAIIVRGTVEYADGTLALVAEHVRPLRLAAAVRSRDFR